MKEQIEPRRLMDAVDSLLTMQNAGGGFASYEKIRGPVWLELFNHAEVFGESLLSCPPLSLADDKAAMTGNIMIGGSSWSQLERGKTDHPPLPPPPRVQLS